MRWPTPTRLYQYPMMRHPIALIPLSGAANDADSAGTYQQQEAEGTSQTWWFRENPSLQVSRRVPYDEAHVIAGSTGDRDRIQSAGPSEYSFIERTVALHKALLQGREELGASRSWLFTHLDLIRVPQNPDFIELKLTGVLGTTVARSSIHCDGDRVGQIAFLSGKR